MLKKDLEPGAALDFETDPTDWPNEREIGQSIAISLKRIADRLDDLCSGSASINADVRSS